MLERGVGIRFNGVEKTNVEEYSVSEGWIRVAAGRSRDRFGNPMTVKLKGVVEPYYEERGRRRAARRTDLRPERQSTAGPARPRATGSRRRG